MYTTRWETMKNQIGQYATTLKTVDSILLIELYQMNISGLYGSEQLRQSLVLSMQYVGRE